MHRNGLFCKIYVDTDRERSWLVKIIASHLEVKSEGRTIESDRVGVDVSRNEDFDPTRPNLADDFVFFRYYLDVVPGPRVAHADYVVAVSSIMMLLLDNDCRAVAACDFEEELQDLQRNHTKQ